MKSFNAICLISPDVAGMRAFYETVLRLPGVGDDNYTVFETRGAGLSIFAAAAMAGMAPEYQAVPGKGEVTFEFEVADVDAEYEHLLALNAPILKPPSTQPWGIRSVWFRDPAGNIVNFFAPVAGGPKSAETIVREYFQRLINEKDLAACDELLSPDYIDHDAPEGAPPGPGSVKEYAAALFEEVPDLRVEILDLLAEGRKVAALLVWEGKRKGSGLPYRQSGMVFLRLDKAGRLAERWSAYE